MFLVFDTETTGKWNFKGKVGDKDQPRLVQIAAVLFNEHYEPLKHYHNYIIPNGFRIPEAATAIHHITNDIAIRNGVFVGQAIHEFKEMVDQAETLIAHNFMYDYNIISNELFHLNENTLWLSRPRPFCTMRAAVNHCKLPNPRFPREYKWPTLSEAHYHFYKRGFEGAHDAMMDAQACFSIFQALKETEANARQNNNPA